MLTHVTGDGVVYEIYVPQEEAQRRMAGMIRFLWPTYLRIAALRSQQAARRASGRGTEEPEEAVGVSSTNLQTKYDTSSWGVAAPQPLVEAHIGCAKGKGGL